MGSNINRAARAAVVAVVAVTLGLGGCVAAAVPILMAATVAGYAVTGFALFKTVQTSTGGAVRIGFGSAEGADAPPPAMPLPAAGSIAVWPGDEKEVEFADRLSATGRFQITSPSAVARTLSARDIPTNMNHLTIAERAEAYETVCRAHGVDLVFIAKDEGTSSESNIFSLRRANLTQTYDLEAYDCRTGSIAWSDRMAVVYEVGGSTPPAGEIAAIAGQAWAERVLEAPQR